jgi:hypothetical protein
LISTPIFKRKHGSPVWPTLRSFLLRISLAPLDFHASPRQDGQLLRSY